MIKAKKIRLILDKTVQLETELKSGMVVSVTCEFLNAEYDRLYLKFPADKEQLAQYFYNDKTIRVSVDTIDGRRIYPAKILYEPSDNLIVVEYYDDENISQKRNILRVRATKVVDVKIAGKIVSMLTIDLSGGGCKLLSPLELKAGMVLNAYLKLRHNENPISVKVKILGCKYLAAESKYEIPVEFKEIKESDRAKIVRFCYNVQADNILGENRLE